jgi:GDP-mannose 6-dehydrogenase
VGHNHSADAAGAIGLYDNVSAPLVSTNIRVAEMRKYASNTWHAVKVCFANEIGAVCKELGVDSHDVMDIFCRDTKLNLSPYYLKPGFAFGGSCLPKDLRALVHRAGRLDLKLPLLESILPSNEKHLDRAVQAVLELPVERIGVFGLSFKENTDDLRESPVVTLLEQLIGKGRDLRVFDPQIQLERIYGSNQRFILSAIPHISKLLDGSFDDTLGWAQHLVVAQKPSARFAEAIRLSGIPVLDLVGAFAEDRPESLTRGAA